MIKSSFFNSVKGDRKYKAEDWAAYFKNMALNGIFAAAYMDCLKVIPDTGMLVKISPGEATINGYHLIIDEAYPIALGYADASLSRIDRIVLRLDLAARNIMPIVLPGTPSDSPSAPDMLRSGDIFDLAIADVSISAGITSVTASMIADLREDTLYCGITNGAIGVTPIERGGTGASTLKQAQANLGIEPKAEYEIVEITTSQTWTVPDGITEIEVTCVGGGGSGSSGRGGSGYIRRKRLQVVSASQHTITIGAAGQNANGGDTKFDDDVIAIGGKKAQSYYGGNGNAGGGAAMSADDFSLYIGGSSQEGGDGGNGYGNGVVGNGCDSATAKGGTARGSSTYGSGAGGGGGVNGGDGGAGGSNTGNSATGPTGGGAGGYGSDQIAPIDATNTQWAKPGKGYGAGGAGAVNGAGNSVGAPGICIIKYRKQVSA